MTAQPIRLFGDPVLRSPAAPVETFDKELLSDEEQDGPEGCLSLPGMVFDTPRALRTVAKGFNMHGEPVEVVGNGLLARCVQHETDHLQGVLFIDRLPPAERKKAMKEIRNSEWFAADPPIVKINPHEFDRWF